MRIVKIIIIILLGVFLSLLASYYILINRIGFWRLIYPLQSQFSILSIECNKNAPSWLKESLKYIIHNQKNLSNQIAYIDTDNHLHTCQSGWKSTSVFSEKLSENTRFRYASLTKLLTSDAILNEINKGKINLSSKLVDLIPEINKQVINDPRINEITIEYLLEHRSGFDRDRSEDIVSSFQNQPWCPYNISALETLKLDFSPGKYYAYDNRNYCILGVVLEKIKKQSYRALIQQKYTLNEKNIKFVDGYYDTDEVKYDFRNNNFWVASDDNRFNFKALSSSAGLSGSAKQLALLINNMLLSKPNNILSISPTTSKSCDIQKYKSCNGYAMWQYKEKHKPIMYFRNGSLPAVTSLAIVTSKNEVIVWIGNGAPLYNEKYDKNLLEKYFYKRLNSNF